MRVLARELHLRFVRLPLSFDEWQYRFASIVQFFSLISEGLVTMSLPKIHCQAVRVPTLPSGRLPLYYAPEDLLPAADPYIAALVNRLEAEVAAGSHPSQTFLCRQRMSEPLAEVPPPSPSEHVQFQSPGDGPWFWWTGR